MDSSDLQIYFFNARWHWDSFSYSQSVSLSGLHINVFGAAQLQHKLYLPRPAAGQCCVG